VFLWKGSFGRRRWSAATGARQAIESALAQTDGGVEPGEAPEADGERCSADLFETRPHKGAESVKRKRVSALKPDGVFQLS